MGVFGPESEDYDEHTETPSSCYGCKQKMDRMTGFVKENLKKKKFRHEYINKHNNVLLFHYNNNIIGNT